MEDLGLKIEEYADELFEDLGLSGLPEDKKADVFARVEEHLHMAILNKVSSGLLPDKIEVLSTALQQQDYKVAAEIMTLTAENISSLNKLIDVEMKKLTLIIEKEQKYERQS